MSNRQTNPSKGRKGPRKLRQTSLGSRMPAAGQRRLNELIDKSKANGLSRREKREAKAILDEVDRKSIQMLESWVRQRR